MKPISYTASSNLMVCTLEVQQQAKAGQDTENAKVFVALFLDECGNPRFLKMRVTPNLKQSSMKKFAHAKDVYSSM